MTRSDILLEKLSAAGADAFLSGIPETRMYFSGFHSTDGTLLITAKETVLIVDFRYIEAAEAGVFDYCSAVMPKDGVAGLIRAKLEEAGAKRLAVEEKTVSMAEAERLKNAYGVELVPASDVISGICQRKDKTELEKIKKAQDITDRAFSRVLKLIKTDMTELEVAAEIEYQMKLGGASGTSFDTICVSGPASALPHGVPSAVKLRRGFLTMDFGCKYEGYCSDMTRTVVIGRADEDVKKVYNTVRKAQQLALDAARPGITGAELDKVARDYIYSEGYEGCFGHGLGHGVGMYIHEDPRVSPAGKTPLGEGHVVTVEPGVYLKGKYGCRIEDMIVFENGGVTDITHSPKDLIEIE
ncbi:MAG: aminopeptidase P family protein [Clostridia bacterium]|nr:aminopeptidase P family protein [Clostridia bacterium]